MRDAARQPLVVDANTRIIKGRYVCPKPPGCVARNSTSMASYDDVDLLDMDFDVTAETYYYPCPCGDKFFITVDDLLDAEELAPCPSCSLLLRVVYDPEQFLKTIEVVQATQEKKDGATEDKEKQVDGAEEMLTQKLNSALDLQQEK